MKSFFIVLSMVISTAAQAALLTYEAGPQNLNGVVLNKTARLNDAQGRPTATSLDLLGAGLRTKTVLVVEAKVYTAQLFSDNKAAFSRDANALVSLVNNSNRVALRIDMLRTVTASALSESFKEALTANGYAIDAELTNILGLFAKSADATNGKSLTLLIVKEAGGKVTLSYEDTKGVVQSTTVSASVMTKIMSIWLGKAADDGLEKLKASLLKPVY